MALTAAARPPARAPALRCTLARAVLLLGCCGSPGLADAGRQAQLRDPPPWQADALLCPPGRCRSIRVPSLAKGGNVQQGAMKQECISGVAAENAKPVAPRGLGEKLELSAWRELTEAGWHNVTCLEVSHGACAYLPGSEEWSICEVAATFLLKMLGELNAGAGKSVPHVRGMLAPYLGGPAAHLELVPDDLDKETAQRDLATLWKQVDNGTATLYQHLGLDAAALADAILANMNQDGFGQLQPEHDAGGKLVQPGLIVQRAGAPCGPSSRP